MRDLVDPGFTELSPAQAAAVDGGSEPILPDTGVITSVLRLLGAFIVSR